MYATSLSKYKLQIHVEHKKGVDYTDYNPCTILISKPLYLYSVKEIPSLN